MSLGRKIAVGFLVVFLVLVLISAYSFRSLNEFTATTRLQEQSSQTLKLLEGVLAKILDVETGERGFLISGADHYLEPYRQSRGQLREDLLKVRGLIEDNPAQRQRLDQLEPLIARKLTFVAQSISERERAGGMDAQTLLEEGQSTMDEIRTLISRMKAEEERLLSERATGATLSRRNAQLVVGSASLAALALMGLAGLAIRLDLGRRRAAEAELKAAEERYRLLFDRSQAGIFRTNREGLLLECNPAFARMLGYRAPEDARGRNAADLHSDREAMAAILRRLLAGETINDVEVALRRRSGETVWALMSVVYNADPADPHFEGTIIDITDRKQASDRLARRLETEQQLKEMGDLLDACLTLTEVYNVVRRSLEGLFPQSAGALHVINSSRNLVETVAAWGAGGAGGETVFAPADCWALRRGRIHVVEKSGDALVCAHLEAPLPDSYICLPLVAQGEAVGVLYFARVAEAPAFTPEEQRVAGTAADKLGLSLANLALRERLRTQSVRDHLTSLFNRRYMEETLERELRRAQRNSVPLSVIMVDVDHFKRFNDDHGHDAGDALLGELGRLLRGHVRVEDVPCRVGGEEFAIVMPGAAAKDALRRAEELREAAQRLRIVHRGVSLGALSISLGVAAFPEHATVADALLRAADSALYRAKREGRDRVVVSDAVPPPPPDSPTA
ncbi:MAG TPA: diguanylate cyclase [Methylomirabilota bacterium]|nr:diguanylate cyclase [Methylomirabilota bacterium]